MVQVGSFSTCALIRWVSAPAVLSTRRSSVGRPAAVSWKTGASVIWAFRSTCAGSAEKRASISVGSLRTSPTGVKVAPVTAVFAPAPSWVTPTLTSVAFGAFSLALKAVGAVSSRPS